MTIVAALLGMAAALTAMLLTSDRVPFAFALTLFGANGMALSWAVQ